MTDQLRLRLENQWYIAAASREVGKQPIRRDVEGETLDRDEVLGQAPLAEDGRFRVPPIIGIEE